MKRMIPAFCFFVVLVFSFSGIANHPSFEKSKNEQQNNVTVISNPKTPQPENGIPIRLIFNEELSIGAEYGDEEYMFGNRVYFNVDVDGNVYVNDWDKKCIRKFDPEGKYLLTIGGPGQGPGEFRNVWHPRFDKDGNLYVSDIVGNRRITRFDRDGTFLEMIRVPIRLSDILINSQGFYIGYQTTMNDDSATTVLGLFDPEFQLLKELHKTTREFTTSSGRGQDSRARFLANLLDDEAFTPNTTFILADDDSVYFGYPEKYEIKIFSLKGKLVRLIKRDYDPIKVGKKHIEGFIRYQEDEFFRFAPYPEDIKKKVFELIEYPEFKPAYDTFILMDNGWIAVVADYIANEYTLFDIFDTEGNYIAQFQAKIPTANLLFRNGKAYALDIIDDYRYIKRYAYKIQEKRNGKWEAKKSQRHG
jgi:hypothetical protein